MCCFSRSVLDVSNTRIFARLAGKRQFLVYELRLASSFDLAMVLPVPVVAGGTLRFIDLSDYATFFSHITRCFPARLSRGALDLGPLMMGGALRVERVGSFDASFVPSPADFERLDPQFRLPGTLWEQIPAYENYGFAVFKFRAGELKSHPMAFVFDTGDAAAGFFPTVHVHDGVLHSTARFDHELFLQSAATPDSWEQGTVPVAEAMDLSNVLKGDRTRGIVDRSLPVSRLILKGDLPNRDVWV